MLATSHCVSFARAWAMPSAWTFTIKPIATLLRDEMMKESGKRWLDPFAGNHSPAQVRNDLRPNTNAQYHEDAIVWLKRQRAADGILLDPPYSLRQVSEHYKEAGLTVTGWHTSAAWQATIKDEAARIVRVGGKAICFGWSSNGLGKSRGFRLDRVLLVAHGGGKNDTIVTVETKVSEAP